MGDEAFRELSKVDPQVISCCTYCQDIASEQFNVQADELLNKAMDEDKSDAWFSKKGRDKKEA